ncbi:MAG: hypothetical protein ACI4CS_04550, partial [Candidatus Weimeria sp.]
SSEYDKYCYTVVLDMYESDGESTQVSSSYTSSCSAGLNSGCDTAEFNCFTFNRNGREMICLEEDSLCYIVGDGSSYDFEELYYNGSGFDKVFACENEASSPEDEFFMDSSAEYNGLKKFHDKGGINADYHAIQLFEKKVYEYIPDKEFIVGSDRKAEGSFDDGYTESDITFGTRSESSYKESLLSDEEYNSLLTAAKKKIKNKEGEAIENAYLKITSVKSKGGVFNIKTTKVKNKGVTYVLIVYNQATSKKIKTVKSKSNSFKIKGLKKGTGYSFTVRVQKKIKGKTYMSNDEPDYVTYYL